MPETAVALAAIEAYRLLREAIGKTETVYSFGWYLRRYSSDALAKGATPFVLSLVPRNDWKDGVVGRAGESYGDYARAAAETTKVAFIDLNAITADKYDAMGQKKVKVLFPSDHTQPYQRSWSAY